MSLPTMLGGGALLLLAALLPQSPLAAASFSSKDLALGGRQDECAAGDIDDSGFGELPDDAVLSMVQRRHGYLLGAAVARKHDEVQAAQASSEPATTRSERPKEGAMAEVEPVNAQPLAGTGGGWPVLAQSHCPKQRAGSQWSHLDVLGAADWELPQAHSPLWLYRLSGFYCSLPAVIVYGLLVLLGGSGSIQLLATAAFWVLIRPAAAAMEALWLYRMECPGAPIRLAAAHAIAAHFYWTWAMLELATRRRPLWQRLAMVMLLGAILLPIPAAQVLLLERSPEQAAAGSLLGNFLGVGFFVGLRLTRLWACLQAASASGAKQAPPEARGALAHWLRPWDNLTTFWGGSVWPRSSPPAVWLPKALLPATLDIEPVRPS